MGNQWIVVTYENVIVFEGNKTQAYDYIKSHKGEYRLFEEQMVYWKVED